MVAGFAFLCHLKYPSLKSPFSTPRCVSRCHSLSMREWYLHMLICNFRNCILPFCISGVLVCDHSKAFKSLSENRQCFMRLRRRDRCAFLPTSTRKTIPQIGFACWHILPGLDEYGSFSSDFHPADYVLCCRVQSHTNNNTTTYY